MPFYMLCKEEDRLIPFFEELGWDYGPNLPEEEHPYQFILQWGVEGLSGEVKSYFVLNGNEALSNLQTEEWRGLLTLQGLKVGEMNGNYRRKLLIPIFQQEVLGIYSNRGGTYLVKEVSPHRWSEFPHDPKSTWVKKVKQKAVRALYALGLDFGSVVMGYTGEEWEILSISPRFPPFSSIFHRMREYLYALREDLLFPWGEGEVKLGADLEFVLHHASGRFLLASHYFPREGEIGCDRIWIRGDRTRRKLPLAELRPAPSSDPRELMKNIVRTLRKASSVVKDKNIRFLAGATPLTGYPIGGHLHFSPMRPNHFLLRALDHYLALPIFLLEDPEGFSRRRRYGFLGDIRVKPHGGFEYRTLPSWLISPRVAKGVLYLGKMIVLHYDRLRRSLLTLPPVQEAFYSGDQEALRQLVLTLWRDLEELPEYERYRIELDRVKEDMEMGRRWNQTEDIRPKWRIPPYD